MRVGANCIEFGVYNSSQKHAAKLPMALCSFTTMLTTAPICQQCWHSRIVEHLGPPAIRPFMPLLKHVIAAYLTDPGNHCMQQCHNCNNLKTALGQPPTNCISVHGSSLHNNSCNLHAPAPQAFSEVVNATTRRLHKQCAYMLLLLPTINSRSFCKWCWELEPTTTPPHLHTEAVSYPIAAPAASAKPCTSAACCCRSLS
jgi:hypothetical protein